MRWMQLFFLHQLVNLTLVNLSKLLAYHLEDSRVPLVVRVPQFGNHCSILYNHYNVTSVYTVLIAAIRNQ